MGPVDFVVRRTWGVVRESGSPPSKKRENRDFTPVDGLAAPEFTGSLYSPLQTTNPTLVAPGDLASLEKTQGTPPTDKARLTAMASQLELLYGNVQSKLQSLELTILGELQGGTSEAQAFGETMKRKLEGIRGAVAEEGQRLQEMLVTPDQAETAIQSLEKLRQKVTDEAQSLVTALADDAEGLPDPSVSQAQAQRKFQATVSGLTVDLVNVVNRTTQCMQSLLAPHRS